MTDTTLYDILGVPRTASAEEIRVAFHERARVLEKDTAHPQAPEYLQRLRQAYQVLGDPLRRKQYDISLPCTDMPERPAIDITQVWKRVGELYFQRSERFTPAIDAVRVAIPLMLEEDNLLILGMDHSHATLMGYLTATVTYNEVRQLLCEVAECQLDLRVIAGTSVKDWQSIKDAEDAIRKKRTAPAIPAPPAAPIAPAAPVAAAASSTTTEQISSALPPQQEPVPPQIEKAGDRWEELMENMFRQWQAMAHRGFPQSRARFVLEQVAIVLRLEDASNTAGVPDEQTQRHVGRAIDRIASLSGIESGAVALEFLRQRVGMNRMPSV